ncbi:MAG: helix-turn-helix domain-containing protein [Bacteroidia bacterium]
MTASEILVTQKEKTSDIENSTQELVFTNFLLKKIQFEGSQQLTFSTGRNILLIQFCLHGECSSKSQTRKKSILFKNSEYNIIYVPSGIFQITSTSPESNVLTIFVEEEFFFRQIQDGHRALKLKNSSVLSLVFRTNLIITPRLRSVLSEMDHCEFDGHLQTLYLKAKILELLTLQLAQNEEEKGVGLKESEIRKMVLVKELIETNLSESYSLAYLAKVVGTNEQYLKKHFKLLFGHTVFGYILECKMQKAKEMLLSGKYRITEIAAIIGYQHATHFTSAFKRFFGYLPKAVKTKMLIVACILTSF